MATQDWDTQACLDKFTPMSFIISKPDKASVKRLERNDVTFEDIAHAYELVAKIVTIYGDKFLPIFERLHREMTKQQSRNELLTIAEEVTNRHLSTENIFDTHV